MFETYSFREQGYQVNLFPRLSKQTVVFALLFLE